MNALRLKSLELNGYKTFASRTQFEFAGPITTIVGPNGSGKSNIADALRWVLGEQSYSLLRARKTEDMIFSGAETRPRAGMASATVVFDNGEGWLPIDFSEVAITRRAYRDGQNEYLINQQKVRLRDVNELLAQSALAERTYTVIGQGLIDTTLTLSSDERRRLFEEAAGIGLYRTRKEQALRRLDATRRNLERVKDILAELRPRLRSLERQAERAQEFTRLRDELRDTLRIWYGYHWNRAQDALRDRREEAAAREENLGLSRQTQSEISQELNQMRGRSQELRGQLNNWHRRLSELHAGREGASRELAVAGERKRALVERRQALHQERQRLETELGTLQARLAEAEKERGRLEDETQEAEGQMEEARRALEEHLSVQQENEGRTETLRERVNVLKGRLGAAEGQAEQIRANIERNQKELQELERTLGAIDESLDAARQALERARRESKVKEGALAGRDNDLEGIRRQIETLKEVQQNQHAERADLSAEKARLGAEIQAFEEADWAAAGFAEGAKWLLQAAREKRLKLARGTLGRELQVDAQYEAAIASALGAYLDAVLLEDGDDPEAALSLLESSDSSVALLPLKNLQANGRLTAPSGKGILGLAVDLVEVPEELRPALDLLLGQVVVTEDRGAARRVLANLPEGARVVTLRGELFHRGGPIEVRSAKASASLSRPRTLRGLHQRLAGVEKQLDGLEDSLAETTQRLADEQHRERAASTAQSASSHGLERAQRAVQSAQLDLEQLDRQRGWFEAQQRSLQREIDEGGEQLAKLAEEQEDLKSQIGLARADLEEHTNSVVELPLDEHRAQVAHWEMRLAVSQRALQEAQRRYNERQGQLQHAQEQLSGQQQAVQDLLEQEEAIQSTEARSRAQEGEVGDEIAAIQSQIGPAERELTHIETRLGSLQENDREAMVALSAAERAHTQAQISLARQQETLETLRARIEDDFGLVAFEYDESVSGPTPLPLGDLVERLPAVESINPAIEPTLKEQRVRLRRLGSVNPEAQQEFLQVKERFENMQTQVADLTEAETDLQEVIVELDLLMEKEFRTTFEKVAAEFRVIFSRLFNGGAARLLLTEEEDLTNTGIDIEARLPGKRAQRLALLSGGERSLTAAALVFALLKASPTPFCVMDEVDAMLDEANVGRFTELLRELSEDTQFVVITHNRSTVQAADVIYGVTMGRDTASQVISLRLDEVDERYSA